MRTLERRGGWRGTGILRNGGFRGFWCLVTRRWCLPLRWGLQTSGRMWWPISRMFRTSSWRGCAAGRPAPRITGRWRCRCSFTFSGRCWCFSCRGGAWGWCLSFARRSRRCPGLCASGGFRRSRTAVRSRRRRSIISASALCWRWRSIAASGWATAGFPSPAGWPLLAMWGCMRLRRSGGRSRACGISSKRCSRWPSRR